MILIFGVGGAGEKVVQMCGWLEFIQPGFDPLASHIVPLGPSERIPECRYRSKILSISGMSPKQNNKKYHNF